MAKSLGWIECDWGNWDAPDDEKDLVVNWDHVVSFRQEISDDDAHASCILAMLVTGKEVTIFIASPKEVEYVFDLICRKLGANAILSHNWNDESLMLTEMRNDEVFRECQEEFKATSRTHHIPPAAPPHHPGDHA